ncbi:hypothetical protein L208DRAFT_1402044 [Tricholoma matsutake]|nr:hypothetical protein L208DRAFT_1402044 [Tricholoma matsutake 945]
MWKGSKFTPIYAPQQLIKLHQKKIEKNVQIIGNGLLYVSANSQQHALHVAHAVPKPRQG